MKNLIFHEKTELLSGKYIREDQFNVHLETLIVYDDQVQSHDPLFPILHTRGEPKPIKNVKIDA